jgi:hypothetical protein
VRVLYKEFFNLMTELQLPVSSVAGFIKGKSTVLLVVAGISLAKVFWLVVSMYHRWS